MSNIRATRRGFQYQDRVGIAIYLQQLQKKNVNKFYIDFPYLSRKSLDIRHFDADEKEIVYEVKSGEAFKKNKNSSEIRDAFLNLKEYSDLSPSATLVLVVRKPFRTQISRYWDSMIAINEQSSFRHPTVKNALDYLYENLRLPDIKSLDELYLFCRKIDLRDFENDERNYNGDRYSDIDDKVLSSIEDLADVCEAKESFYEFPSEMLMYTLYDISASNAGTTTDVHPIFLKKIEDFFTFRKFLNHCNPPGEHGRTKENSRLSIQQKIRELTKKNIIIENKIASVVYRAEGESL